MAYRRGGVFRSRFIAPASQRATEILSKPIITQARLFYETSAKVLATTVSNGGIVTFTPLTVSSASGQERLVILGGSGMATVPDFGACTIDGQVAARVGLVSRATIYPDEAVTFVTAYRAPGTSNTSINVTATASIPGTQTLTDHFCAVFRLSNAGTLGASTNNPGHDPVLNVNTTASGTVAAGLMAFARIADLSGTGHVAWTGLTERLEDNASANLVFSVASADISSASTPLAILGDETPNLQINGDSTASISLSFNPVLLSSLPALSGNYTLTGAGVMLTLAHNLAALPGSYAMTGTNATTRRGLSTVAASASYAMTGQAASPNRSAGATASIVFDTAIADGANKINGEAYTFPLTVAASAGDRLVIVGGIAHALTGDFTACTIDGQIATRVGTVSRGQPDGSIAANSNAAFLTAYRAPGTSSTSINVVATLASGGDGSFSGYCACFRTTGVGAVYASTNNNVNDPTLSTDTVNSGAVVAALLGYDLGGPPVNAVNWTGLTERFDDVNTAGVEVFSGASANISSGASPTVITADITPNLTTLNEDTIASICLSFLPSGSAGTTLAANVGSYVMTGQTALTLRGRKAVITTVGSYALTGADATMHAQGRILADPGAYVLTGNPVATIKSGANKLIDALPGAYALTGATVAIKRGTKISVTSVGAYAMTGTSPITTGMGLIAVAGSYAMTGTPASLVYRAGPNISIVVGTAPLTASAGTATVHTTVGILVSGSGNVATVSVGNPTVLFSGGVSVLVSAPAMTASVGTVSPAISGGIEVSVTGFEMTASVGNATVVIPARVTVTGNFMTANVGTVQVNVLGSATMLVFGNRLDASVGTVTFATNANMSVTGNEITASVGAVNTFTLVGAIASGNEMTVSVGDVTVTAKQNTVVNVDGNALVAFVGTLDFAGGGTITHPNLKNREGRMLQPSNWMGA